MSKRMRLGAVALLMMCLAGCATQKNEHDFAQVQSLTQDRLSLSAQRIKTPQDQQVRDQKVAELLSKPLSIDAAMQLALLNSPSLQASYAELEIAQADREQSARWANPKFSFGRLNRAGETEWERGLHLNVAQMLTTPIAAGIEDRNVAQAQSQAAMETLTLAMAVRKAWFSAVASGEMVRYAREVVASAEASAELATRMVKTGNWNRLEQAREQGFHADAQLNLAKALQLQASNREQLIRLIGLWGAQTAFELPERLPELPKKAHEWPTIEQEAMAKRLDLQVMKARSEALARNLGLSKVNRWVNVLEFGGVRNSSNQAAIQTGYDISLEIPLFDWGEAKVAKAEAIYMQSIDQLAQAAIEARSQSREAYRNYRFAFDIASHYREVIVPNQKLISEENQLRYNGMFISVFDLLADARAQISAVTGYIESVRDFWLAQSDLQMVMMTSPSRTAP